MLVILIPFIFMALATSEEPNPPSKTGPHNPHCDLNLNLSVSEYNVNRSGEFLLIANYSSNIMDIIKNNEEDILYFEYPVGSLNKNFEIIKIDNITLTKPSKEIIININSNNSSKNWTITSDINISTGPMRLFYPESIKTSTLQLRLGNQMYLITPEITFPDRKRYIEINIMNNIPRIDTNNTKVSIKNNTFIKDSNLILWNPSNDLEVNHIISANDKEDGKDLKYIWKLKNKNDNKSIEQISNLSESRLLWKLESGERYEFYASAMDSEGDYSKPFVLVNISQEANNFSNVWIPPWKYYIPNLIYTLIIATLFSVSSVFIIILKSGLCLRLREIPKIITLRFMGYNPIVNALLSAGFATIIFLGFLFSDFEFGSIYRRSLAIYELYIFIIVYILFGYLAEEVFFKTDKKGSKYNIIIINDFLMIFSLAAFYGISLGITHDIYTHLANYYMTITGISGTLLGFILGFYIAKFNDNQKQRSTVYLNTLEYLVLLFGTIIILSLWGLSFTRSISFMPIIQLSTENLMNIVSIWIFESTILLIPLAITSLYRLIKAAS